MSRNILKLGEIFVLTVQNDKVCANKKAPIYQATKDHLNTLLSKPCPYKILFSFFPRIRIMEDIAISTVKL